MAESVCDIRRKLSDDVKQQNLARTRFVKDSMLKFADIKEEKLAPLNDFLEENFGEAVIDGDEFDQVIENLYGKKDENLKLAIKIQTILQNNEIYWDWAREYVIKWHPKALTKKGGDLGVQLDSLPNIFHYFVI